MVSNIRKCPCCKARLIYPRNDTPYCEECGWPTESRGGRYAYPQEGEELSNYQPGLQFFDYENKKWVESGLNFGRCSFNFVGFYRYKKTKGSAKC